MSENKTEQRTLETIQQEYSAVCAKLGHAAYQVWVIENDLDILRKQARDLNLEAAKIQSESKVEAKNE